MATLEAQTFDGLPDGTNLADPQHEIQDTEARYIQDALLDYPGLVRRRGPVQAANGFPTFTKKASGMVGVITPAGLFHVAVLTGDGSGGQLGLISDDYATKVDYTWSHILPNSPFYIVDAKPTLLGGATIGTSAQYNSVSSAQALAFWRGGNKADYATGTLSLTRGSTTVTGGGTTWSSNVTAGMFLFATVTDLTNTGKFSLTYVGVVKSVDSNTQLTLVDVSPYTTAATAYNLTSVRGFQYKIVKGRVTIVAASTTVTGANTKFVSQFMDEVVSSQNGTTHTNTILDALTSTATLKVGMRVTGTNVAANTFIVSVDSATQVTLSAATTGSATNTMTFKHGWNFYRASDMTWLGRLSVVNNEISVTLAANTTTALNNEKFIALCGTGDWGLDVTSSDRKVGFLNAFYAGRQWYANNMRSLARTSRVWFSDTGDPEGVDLSSFDGDFFDVSSSVGTDTPIKALVPAYNGLVLIKENETYAVTGNTPTTFNVKKIQDDGALSGMSAVAYGGGVVWAGVEGIYFYDGITVNNLASGKLGNWYKNAVRNIDPTSKRMYGMLDREHYFLFIEQLSPSVGVQKGNFSYTPTSMTICINLKTQAFTLMTNVNNRGYLETPADTGKQVLYAVNDSSKANICQGFDLFDAEAVDVILCDSGSSAGIYRYGQLAVSSASSFNGVADTKYFSPITLSARGAVRSITIYTTGQGGGSGACNTRAGIYSDVSGVPTNLLGSSAVVVLDKSDGAGFREYSFSSPVELAAGTYWIGVQVETSSRVAFYRLSTANKTASATDTYADGLATPFGAVTNNNGPMISYASVLSVGPDLYIESKKFTEGDSLHKKLFKQLKMEYISQGDSLRLDTVPGLQTIGKTASSSFPTTVYTWDGLVALFGSWDALATSYPTWDSLTQANFKPKRIKFLKRSDALSFRLWQNSPAVSRVQIGPFQIAYKWQRLGRV